MSTTTFEAKVPAVQVMQVRKAWKAGDGHFEVLSRDGKRRYQVRVEGGMPLCDCTAAKFGQPCYHAAVVLRRLMNEAERAPRGAEPTTDELFAMLG